MAAIECRTRATPEAVLAATLSVATVSLAAELAAVAVRS
jgi:hypothetical protein